MKIVDVCAFYSPRGGGVKTYVGQKLAMAERMGQDITILAPADADAVADLYATLAGDAARLVAQTQAAIGPCSMTHRIKI